jgi:hypothetical protein
MEAVLVHALTSVHTAILVALLAYERQLMGINMRLPGDVCCATAVRAAI